MNRRSGDAFLEQIAGALLWLYINYEKCAEKTNRIFDGPPAFTVMYGDVFPVFISTADSNYG